MKTIFNLFIILNLILFSFTACEKTQDDEPDVDPRDQYLGDWLCTEDDSKNTDIAYTVNISYDESNSSQVLLKNFNLFGPTESVYALVTSSVITVPLQTVLNNTVNGKGNKIDDNTINWEYYVNDGADIDTISAIYTK